MHSCHKCVMSTMTINPGFKIRTETNGARRLAFQFTLSGTEQSGVVYVNRNIPEGADLMDEARKAAKIACKRAGAETAELWAIQAPTR